MFRSYRDLVRTPKPAEKSIKIKGYDCDLCDHGGWLSENDVEIHRKEAHFVTLNDCRIKNQDRFCSICMTLHQSKQELISHIKQLHLLSSPNAKRVEHKIYICDVCRNIFFNKNVLAAHMIYTHLTHRNERECRFFTCPICFKNIRLNATWYHLQKHDAPSVSMCDICLINLSNREELLEHLKAHPGYFNCDPCGIKFNNDTNFYQHLDSQHNKLVPIGNQALKAVSKVFKRNNNLGIRYNVHNSFKGLSMQECLQICTLCREICLSKKEARHHIERDHMRFLEPVKKRHRCTCGDEFPYKVVLKQHIMKMKGSHQPLDEPIQEATELETSVEEFSFEYVDQGSNDSEETDEEDENEMVS